MEQTKKVSPKDVFLHLLNITSLYISAGSFIALVFQFINKLIRDPLLLNGFYHPDFDSPLRWSIASLVIIFPVFIFSSWLLDKGYSQEPEKRNLKIRKWLIYFTLFAAALVIIGDLVALIYNFLNGDLSIKFLLKIFTVLFVAGSVFIYYGWNVRSEKIAWQNKIMRALIVVVVSIVGASTIIGFFVAGSPFQQRLKKFDERKIQDLQSVQWQIVNFWQRKDKLPDALDDLKDNLSGFSAPKDPQTGLSYEYKKLDELKFEFCANFNTASIEGGSLQPKPAYPETKRPTEDNWFHPTGQKCFERTIDPDLYRIGK